MINLTVSLWWLGNISSWMWRRVFRPTSTGLHGVISEYSSLWLRSKPPLGAMDENICTYFCTYHPHPLRVRDVALRPQISLNVLLVFIWKKENMPLRDHAVCLSTCSGHRHEWPVFTANHLNLIIDSFLRSEMTTWFVMTLWAARETISAWQKDLNSWLVLDLGKLRNSCWGNFSSKMSWWACYILFSFTDYSDT
jgi:hypothetical protein